jgi:hypothetical protein
MIWAADVNLATRSSGAVIASAMVLFPASSLRLEMRLAASKKVDLSVISAVRP